MKNISQLNLKENEVNGLKELKKEVLKKILDAEIIIYGSKARGEGGEFSDIDILILTDSHLDRALKDEIGWLKYEIELKYNIVIGMIIENKDYWKTPLANAMPLHHNIDHDGVLV